MAIEILADQKFGEFGEFGKIAKILIAKII